MFCMFCFFISACLMIPLKDCRMLSVLTFAALRWTWLVMCLSYAEKVFLSLRTGWWQSAYLEVNQTWRPLCQHRWQRLRPFEVHHLRNLSLFALSSIWRTFSSWLSHHLLKVVVRWWRVWGLGFSKSKQDETWHCLLCDDDVKRIRSKQDYSVRPWFSLQELGLMLGH